MCDEPREMGEKAGRHNAMHWQPEPAFQQCQNIFLPLELVGAGGGGRHGLRRVLEEDEEGQAPPVSKDDMRRNLHEFEP